MSLLELKGVSKIYGDPKALDNVNIHVDKGEWVAIMGPSGSGKSTMMNIIGCMDRPSSGEVLLDGVDISKESSKSLTDIRRDKIGLVFQQRTSPRETWTRQTRTLSWISSASSTMREQP